MEPSLRLNRLVGRGALMVSDHLKISRRATFDVPAGYIVIGRLGSVQMGQLSFNTDFAEVRLSGRMQLAGSVRANDVVLSSSSVIGDSPTAEIRIQRNATFRTPKGVYLADGLPSQNLVSFCGHVFFGADQFAIVNESGFARIGSWSVKPGAFQSISVDSRTCET